MTTTPAAAAAASNLIKADQIVADKTELVGIDEMSETIASAWVNEASSRQPS